VGEILAGILVGTSGLDIVRVTPGIEFLAEFGFAFLMFVSGLEVDFSVLTSDRPSGETGSRWIRRPVVLAAVSFAATLVLSYVVASSLSAAGALRNPILMALILSTTSLGIVVPVLKGKDLLGRPFGQTVLGAATLADFLTLILLTVAIVVAERGTTVDLLLVPAFLFVFLVAARALVVWVRQPALRRFVEDISHPTSQIRVRGAFALMVISLVLAEAAGLELILGAFLAGIVFRLIGFDREAQVARERLEAIGYGFFIPLFFIMVGVRFNLPALVQTDRWASLVPALLLGAYAVKVLPILIWRVRYSWKESLAAGFLMSSRLSLLIAASAIALSLGVISEAVNAAVVLLAILTCTISPLVFERLIASPEDRRRSGYLLIGSDPLLDRVALRLHDEGYPVTVIEAGRDAAERTWPPGIRRLEGDARDPAMLRTAGAATAQGLMAFAANAAEVQEVCEVAATTFRVPLIVASVHDAEGVTALQAAGVRVIQPRLATAVALEAALRFPGVFDVLARTDDEIQMDEIEIRQRGWSGTTLSQLKLEGNPLVVSVRRGAEVIIPHGGTALRPGDRLGMIGSPESLEAARGALGD
jgi:Kef-type K+ transport system membrane component KefB/Trk K+ transport system NAD-binding subunit